MSYSSRGRPPDDAGGNRSIVPFRQPLVPTNPHSASGRDYSRGNNFGTDAGLAITPLEFMLAIMRSPQMPLEMRMDAAKNAAPYLHTRLSPQAQNDGSGSKIEVSGGLPLPGIDEKKTG